MNVGIVALDIHAADEVIVEAVRGQAADLGIAPERVLVNWSHTHCGPAVRRSRDAVLNGQFDEDYLSELTGKLTALLRDAAAGLREARLYYTVGSCTMGINRRRPGTTNLLPNADKPIDTDVPVMRVLTPDGDVRAVLFSYACHPTVMGGRRIGPDYVGPAMDLLREAIPGCVPVFLQGCGGDIKPRNVTADGTFASGSLEAVGEFGRELGRAVLAALCGTPEALGPHLAGAGAVIDLPTQGTPGEDVLAACEKGPHWQKAWVSAVRRTIAEKGRLADVMPVEVQALDIGGLCIVGLPGEIFCRIGLELKEKLPDRKLWTLGYANQQRYVVSRDTHAESGSLFDPNFIYCLTPSPCPLGLKPESVDVILSKSLDLARAVQA